MTEPDGSLDPAGAPLLFVCGLHRSGTSVLARVLAGSPGVTAMTGTGVPEDEGQHLQDVLPPASAHGGPGLFAFDPDAHLTQAHPLVTRRNAVRILASWYPHWHLAGGEALGWDGQGDVVLLEKSPPNLVRTTALQALFPDARFLVVTRHPGIVAASTRRWRPQVSPGTLVRHWARAHRLFRDDEQRLRHVHVLRYEDLVATPAAVLARAATALGIRGPFDAGLLDGGRSASHAHAWITAWRGLDRAERRELDHLVRAFGYRLDSTPAARGVGRG